MRQVSKSRRAHMYGLLLHLYPTMFQRHYAGVMEQTFDDMLDDEPTWQGHCRIWLRTLIELPFSAAKEHITDGKEALMTRNFKLLAASAAAAVLVASAGSFWFGVLHARTTTTVDRVSVTQLGDAMQHDMFYSRYGNAALVFSAQVASVTQGNTTSATFVSDHPYGVSCRFTGRVRMQAGQTMAIIAPGGKAERLAHGVALHDCIQQ